MVIGPASYFGHGFNPDRFHPGYLEVFYGPMKANKSGQLIKRVDAFQYSGGLDYIAFKPEEDTRTPGKIVSRMGIQDKVVLEIPAIEIPKKEPYEALNYIKDKHGLVAFDEAEMFLADIVPLVESLLSQNRNVLISGLNLNFRGENYGLMHYFITHAERPYPLFAACAYSPDDSKTNICAQRAQFTQRLINNQPAPYLDDEEVIEKSILPGTCEHSDRIVTYEPRCRQHFVVPGKPKLGNRK